MPDQAASVIARLKNLAKNKGLQLQQFLNLFCQEEFLRRLSNSPYADTMILKGGYLLYAISGFSARSTMDADYLLKNHSNDTSALEQLIQQIIRSHGNNDLIGIELKTLEHISEQKEYHGIRAHLIGHIGKTRTPFSIDLGVGDTAEPMIPKRSLPVLIEGFSCPEVLTYPLESVISEKLHSILYLMEANSRMKDFYDIHYLALTCDFEAMDLMKALQATFKNRNYMYDEHDIINLKRILQSSEMQARWKNFTKRVLKFDISFGVIINTILQFIHTPYISLCRNTPCTMHWIHDSQEYQKGSIP